MKIDQDNTNTSTNIKKQKTKKIKKCAFCGKTKDEVYILFNGNDACICNDCVEQIYFMNLSIINQLTHFDEDHFDEKHLNDINNFQLNKTPKQIKEFLDQYVIGQDIAKQKLSTIVYNHYKRINQEITDDIEIEKSNILLIGNSGVGKTFLAQTLAKFLNVGFAIADCTSITQAGYVGDDIETVITRVLQNTDYDIKKTENAIVYLDECDKIARKSSQNSSITRDVSGEGVQQGLLKLLEGTIVQVPPKGGRKHPEAPMISINTKNILFILGGAFVGIDDIIKRRLETHALGFNTNNDKKDIDENNIIKYINSEDLITYGLIPEFVGRIPIITYLNPLSKNDMKRILTEPKNAIIKQYKKLLELDNIKLIIDEDVYDFLVDCAYKSKLGARSLRTIVEILLGDDMYNLPDNNKTTQTLHITLDYAKEKLNDFLNTFKD